MVLRCKLEKALYHPCKLISTPPEQLLCQGLLPLDVDS